MATLGKRRKPYEAIATLAVVLVLSGLTVDAVFAPRDGEPGWFSSTAMWAAGPFLRTGAAAHNAMGTMWSAAFAADKMRAENDALRARIAEMRVEAAAGNASMALATINQQMSTNIPPGSYELLVAPVLSAPKSGGRQIAWIDVGENSGLAPGMVVMSPDGIVGEVDRVFETTALVELITDEQAAWGAEIDGRGEVGLVRGTGAPDIVEFHFARTSFDAEIGDRVVSSGMSGSIAPGGVPFGTIEEIRTNKNGEPIAVVRLSGEPGKLRTLFVLPVDRIPAKAPK